MNSTKEPQSVVDMAILAQMDGDADPAELALDVNSPAKKSNVDLVKPSKAARNNSKPRSFGKRAKSDADLVKPAPKAAQDDSKKSFGKRAKSDADLVEPAPRVVEVKDLNNKVDILFVVDSSFSMKEVLRSIPEKMDGFVPALNSSLDWRVGFINAKAKHNRDKQLSSLEFDGALVEVRKYITKHTASSKEIFIDSLTPNPGSCKFPPNCGGFREAPLLALNKYLASPNRGVKTGTALIREDAHLAVVIMTDNRENRIKGEKTTADDVLYTMEQVFGEDKEFSVHTLATVNDACRSELKADHFFAEGERASEAILLARETGGASLSLCSHDYAVPLVEAIETSVFGVDEEVDCSLC